MIRRGLAFICALFLLLAANSAAFAKARLIVVFPLRSTPALSNQAANASRAIVAKLAGLDGYDAKLLPEPTGETLGKAAAAAGAEVYVVGQLLATESGYKISLGSFSAATDQSMSNYSAELTTADALPDQPDIKLLINAPSPTTASNPVQSNLASDAVTVPGGLPVKVLLIAPLSSSSAEVDQEFTFKAAEDIVANGKIVVEKGAEGEGKVAVAEHAGANGHPGKLGLEYEWISSVDGSRIPLSATANQEVGEGKKGAASTATIASYIVLGPLGLFMHNFVHGKEITLDTRTPLTAYVDHTVHVVSTEDAVITTHYAK